MASLSTRDIDGYSISCYISGLQYPCRKYDYLYITDTNCGSGQVSYLTYDSAKQTFYPNTNYYNYACTLSNGIRPNTSYTFYAYGKINGKIWYIGRSRVRTRRVTVKPGRVSMIWQNSCSSNSLDIGWKEASNADYYEIKITNTKTGSPEYYTSYSNSYRIRGLTAGVKYRILVRGVNSDIEGDWSSEKFLYTQPETPTMKVYETANEHIKIQVNVSGYWSYVNIYCPDTGQTVRVQYNDSSKLARFYNLKKSTTYTFYARTYIDGVSTASEQSYISATTSGKPRPQNFWWWSEKTKDCVKLDDREWNSFTSRINEFRSYKNLASISFYQVSEGITFKAAHYNQAKNAINDMNSTGLSDVKKGQQMKFETLATNLNRMANKLNEIE